MSDSQFGLLIATLATFLSGVIGMLRWAVNRITKALDDNTASNKDDAEGKIRLAEQMAVLSTKIDAVAKWVEHHTPVEGIDIDEHRRNVERSERSAPHRRPSQPQLTDYYYGPDKPPKKG